MNFGFPIHTEIIYLLKKLKAEDVNKMKDGKKTKRISREICRTS